MLNNIPFNNLDYPTSGDDKFTPSHFTKLLCLFRDVGPFLFVQEQTQPHPCRNTSPSGPSRHYPGLEPRESHFARRQPQRSLSNDHPTPFPVSTNTRFLQGPGSRYGPPPPGLSERLSSISAGPDYPEPHDSTHPVPPNFPLDDHSLQHSRSSSTPSSASFDYDFNPDGH